MDHYKSALMNLNLCLAIKHIGYSTVKNCFNESNCGRPKTAIVSENIDAVHELIVQDCHVAYREIKAFLGISSTNIHSIWHEHLAAKKIRSC